MDVYQDKNGRFEDIYSSFSGLIFDFAYKMTGNRTIADDITQDTFVKVYQNYENFRGECKLSTWIFTIAKNLCFRHYKKEKRNSFETMERMIDKESSSDHDGQFGELESKYYVSRVKEGCLLGLLRCLSFNQRLSFILNILIDMPVKTVSLVVGKTENSARILIHRARNNIKKFLCDNCSLYDEKNKCRCERLVSFSLKQEWIEKYQPSVYQDAIESEIKEFKDEVSLYRSLDGPVFQKKVSEIIGSGKYSIFSGKKVK
jgi:RNA polymerase sigma factor (sigma-70 family)